MSWGHDEPEMMPIALAAIGEGAVIYIIVHSTQTSSNSSSFCRMCRPTSSTRLL
jgi:hypothetical protein